MENRFKYNLKQLRKEKDLTQQELADALDITLKTVSHWETGYTEPCIAQILYLSDFFNVSLEELLR